MNDTNPGIDYSLGRSNFNPETLIHFGVISANAVNSDCWAEAEADYGKPSCPKCNGEVLDSQGAPDSIASEDWFDGRDWACTSCQECFWGDQCFPDEALSYSYDKDGYQLTNCLDNDIMVLASPYFTFAQYCSPCVPGAGNLESPTDPYIGPKTYCLGPEWFDEYSPMPYRCWRLSNNIEVTT